ncbi:MAG TPA: hypothetical protein VLT33_43435, partial [Labilithrix sp.]|nr:hypothetical protein [Labilithrix sp.]
MTRARTWTAPLVGAVVVLGLAATSGGLTRDLALAALAVGAALGGVALGLLHLRYGAARRDLLRELGETLALCLALEGALVAWGMAESPALYAAGWYARGGLARTIQIFASDVLGPHGVVLVAIVVAIAYVGPRRIPRSGRALVLTA